MTFSADVLKNEEKAMMNLRALYRRFGYTQYKMSKFEEYDLYVRNKSFLASDHIITFNDMSGRLMALKPDVTLSIVKNTQDCGDSLYKYFYNENVYRLSSTSREFKERMQVGLECIGHVDVYSMSEVILLADRSLRTISDRYSLELSHMGFLSGLLDDMALTPDQGSAVLRCISEKNAPEIKKLWDGWRLPAADCDRLMALATLYGPFEEAIAVLRGIGGSPRTDAAVAELELVYDTVRSLGGGDGIHLDFSIVNDMNYYSGIIFQGFVDGIPTGILSGGRYDNLMLRFGKTSGAIGFAVYLDLLERFGQDDRDYDVDVLLLYGDDTPPAALAEAVRRLTEGGKSVLARRSDTHCVKYRQLYQMNGGRCAPVEPSY